MLRTWRRVAGRRAITQPAATTGAAAAPALAEKAPQTDHRAALHRLLMEPEALVVTRELEWGNVLVGFEQANKYTIRAAPSGDVVGHIAEDDSLGKSLTRNLLRTHRAFKATVFDPHMNPLLQIHRPMYLVSTSLSVTAADSTAEPFGEVHMHWHMWRRRYDLFNRDKVQFARIDGGFLSLDFELKDRHRSLLASINRDFTGLARELFTDAGQYVIRMGPSTTSTEHGDGVQPATMEPPRAPVSPLLSMLASPSESLPLEQRAVTLGTAVCVDFDYFSRHSRSGGGWAIPWFLPPSGGSTPADDTGSPTSTAQSGDQSTPIDYSGRQTEEGPSPDANSDWPSFQEHDHGFQPPPTVESDGVNSGESADEEGGGSLVGAIFRKVIGLDDE